MSGELIAPKEKVERCQEGLLQDGGRRQNSGPGRRAGEALRAAVFASGLSGDRTLLQPLNLLGFLPWPPSHPFILSSRSLRSPLLLLLVLLSILFCLLGSIQDSRFGPVWYSRQPYQGLMETWIYLFFLFGIEWNESDPLGIDRGALKLRLWKKV